MNVCYESQVPLYTVPKEPEPMRPKTSKSLPDDRSVGESISTILRHRLSTGLWEMRSSCVVLRVVCLFFADVCFSVERVPLDY